MRTYLKYEDSGVECIGEIPKVWDFTRMVSVGRFSKGKNITKDELRDIGHPCIVYSQLYTEYERLVTSVISFIDDEKVQQTTKVNQGTFLFTSSGETIEDIGKCVLYDGDSEVSVGGDMVVFRVKDETNFNNYFLSYVFNSNFFQYQKSENSRGEIVVHVYERQLRDMRFPFPPLPEQNQIVSYLDRKTHQISNLIKGIEQKIELLKERRVLIINEVVTKGLNPKVEMKESRVEWVGEIPVHWRISKLKYLVFENQESLSNSTDPDLELDYIEISNVNSDGEISNPTKYIFSESPSRCRRVCRKGDVIVSTVRTYLKSIGIIEEQKENLICSTGFSVLTPKSDYLSKYIFYMLRSNWFISKIISKSEGVSYPSIQSPKLLGTEVVIMDKKEQQKIVEYLDREIQKIDKDISIEEKKVELLKEYKKSLISEVVSGKKKVVS